MPAADLDPKSQFKLLHQDHYRAFAELVVQPSMRVGINFALIQLTHSGVTTDQLNGAKKFINILSNLSNDDPPATLPRKALKNG